MPVYFKLTHSTDSTSASVHAKMLTVESEECHGCDDPTVESITPKEFESLTIGRLNANISPVDLIDLDNNFAEDYPDYIVGSFSVPSRDLESVQPYDFAFYLDKDNLIFIDESGYSNKLLAQIADSGLITDASTVECMHLFLKEMLGDDMVFLSQLEDRMEDIEERLLVKHTEIDSSTIMNYRRYVIHLNSFYQQMTTMSSLISDNENKMLTHEQTRNFRHIANLCERLSTRAETLKEYTLQLSEMQQTFIDIQQNSIMQVLTIVTVLLAPMTLITGWFGMNLSVIPGLGESYMWIALIVAFVVCTAVLLFIFHKKKWL